MPAAIASGSEPETRPDDRGARASRYVGNDSHTPDLNGGPDAGTPRIAFWPGGDGAKPATLRLTADEHYLRLLMPHIRTSIQMHICISISALHEVLVCPEDRRHH